MLVLALLALIGWLALKSDAPPVPAAAVATSGAPQGPQFFGEVNGQPAAALPGERARQRQQLVDNYALTDHTYCSYREGSMYPAHSRPMSQNTDQAYPNKPVLETNPMRGDDRRSNPDILIQTSQSRVYLAAGESVAFSLRAIEPKGAVLPLVVTRALAAGMVTTSGRPTTQVPLAFTDDGSGADPVAGDGAFTGVLTPAQTGLGAFHGTIRTEVR